jgi:DNA-binding IclR family transcriptional regulator
LKALLQMLQESRKRRFSLTRDVYAPGLSAVAAPVRRKGEPATGVVVVAGPSMRLTEARLLEFGPELLRVAAELAQVGSASPLLKSANLGTWGNHLS